MEIQASRAVVVETRPAAKREPALDGVRGLAVLMVIIHHIAVFGPFTGSSLIERTFNKAGMAFSAGVDLFFVLSGFLITRILLTSKKNPNYFKNFYIRRTLRIFPLYYLFVALFFLVIPRFLNASHSLNQEAPFQLWYWFYVPNVHIFLQNAWMSPMTVHCWSLAIEEQFYLFWPCLVYFSSEAGLLRASSLLFFMSIAFRAYLVLHGYGDAAVRAFTPGHLDGLMLGSILAVLYKRGTGPRSWSNIALFCFCAGISMRLALAIGPQGVRMDELKQISLIGIGSIFFAGVIAKAVSAPEGRFAKTVLGGKTLTSLGTYSYGLYLFHQPIFSWFSDYLSAHPQSGLMSRVLFLLIPLPLSFLTAWLLFNFYEMPFLKLKERFH